MRPLTCSCFLILLLERLFLFALLFLLGTPFLLPWSSSSPLLALVLISLSLAKVRLSLTLTLSPLTIWCSEQTALFLFFWAKTAVSYLPTALFVALRPLFPFQTAQYPQVSLLKPAPFCKLFAGLGSTNKSATSLLLLSDSRSVLSSIFPSTSISLAVLVGTVFSLLLFYQANGSPDTRFSQGTKRLMSWPDGERYLRPPQSLVVSLVLSLVSTLFFSRTGGVLSHRNSSIHRFPQFPPRNFCSLVSFAVFSLVYAETNTAIC